MYIPPPALELIFTSMLSGLESMQLFEDKRHYYIVTGVSKGGDLFRELKIRGPFADADAAVLMKQILVCVNYCHKNNIVHRDLKPGSKCRSSLTWSASSLCSTSKFSAFTRFHRRIARREQKARPNKNYRLR
jgi:hypothetical protein